ncbi:unnamed protein product [Closterium sp. NIES-53]
MALRPSSIPQRVVLPELPTSSLPHFSNPESDLSRAVSPTVTHLLASVVTDPDLKSAAAFALVTELVEFAAKSRLDYVASLLTEHFELECLAATLPRFASMLLCPEGDPDALDIPTPCSYAEAIAGTYVNEVPPPGANIVDGMWIFILRRPPEFTGSFPAGTQWSLWRPVYGLRQAPRELHDTLRTTLAALGFAPSSADPSLFLRTYTTLLPFYVLVYRFGFQFSSPLSTPLSTGHSLSAPPLDESVEPSGPYPELVGCLITSGMGLVLRGQGSVVLTGQSDASWADNQATQRSSQGYTFSLGSGSVSWMSTRSSSVLGSSCEAEIYAGAMAAQELRWLTYLLTDLGERPRSPPVLYVDNKAMLALCHEQRLEHSMRHIAFRYFLARELLQRRQLRLSYVASWVNTSDVFTKALGSALFCFAFALLSSLTGLARATTGPPVGSASETGTGAASGVSEVQSRKKQRDALESSVKMCKASAEEGPVAGDARAPPALPIACPAPAAPPALPAAPPRAAAVARVAAAAVLAAGRLGGAGDQGRAARLGLGRTARARRRGSAGQGAQWTGQQGSRCAGQQGATCGAAERDALAAVGRDALAAAGRDALAAAGRDVQAAAGREAWSSRA